MYDIAAEECSVAGLDWVVGVSKGLFKNSGTREATFWPEEFRLRSQDFSIWMGIGCLTQWERGVKVETLKCYTCEDRLGFHAQETEDYDNQNPEICKL